MKILVTGVSGHVGPFVVRELTAAGHEVVGLDQRAPPEAMDFRKGDIERPSDVLSAAAGCDAVIHLAAIRAPGLAPPEVTLRVNVVGTMNVLEAAVTQGLSRCVVASSDSALGFCFREREMTPDYFPIDEDHPLRPQDCYGLSKAVAEEVCRSYTRRGRISTVCLRTCDVWYPERPDARSVIQSARAKYRTLWVYVHALDVARAYRLACETSSVDHETLFISAKDALCHESTLDLLRAYYPDVPLRHPFQQHQSLVSGARAEARLGFVPTRSWRDDLSPR